MMPYSKDCIISCLFTFFSCLFTFSLLFSLRKFKFEFFFLDGQTPHEDRDRQIQEYNAEGSEKFIFMLSTRAGGMSAVCLHFDSYLFTF